MSANPNPLQETPAISAAQLTESLSLWATATNAALISEYQQGVATAAQEGLPAPAPPMLFDINAGLILQLENAPTGTATAAQWSGIIFQVQMPAPNTPPAPAPLVLTAVAAGVWKVTINSGLGPTDGQLFAVDGVQYKAFWVGPFGPVEATLAPVSA